MTLDQILKIKSPQDRAAALMAARLTPADLGTTARKLGISPRQLQINPRAEGTNPRRRKWR